MPSRTCSTCAHDGSCDHYCGGSHWSAAFVPCSSCGALIPWEFVDLSDDHGHVWCDDVCMSRWYASHPDEDGADEVVSADAQDKKGE